MSPRSARSARTHGPAPKRRRGRPGTAPGTLAPQPDAAPSTIEVVTFGPAGVTESTAKDAAGAHALVEAGRITFIIVTGVDDHGLLVGFGEQFDLHRLALEDVAHTHQRPKFDEYADQDFVVLRVPDPDGLEGGLVDPGLLPAAWLQALVTAGCDLLLIRGIPWRALPAGDDAAAPAAAPGIVAPEGLDALTDDALTVEAPAWRAARARLWAVAAAGWADPDLDLGWIDATTGDRWGAADARSGAAFTDRLGHLFAAVRHVDGDPAVAGFRPGRLLVTSHRPLALTALAALHPARSGVAVAMGHPSLAGDLTRFLGAGWRVGQVYDCDVADLEPESSGPVQ